MLHRPPHNRFEDLESVYLVGGGTHPGSGLPVIYESSRITCKQMLSDLGLDCEFIHRAQAATATVAAPAALGTCSATGGTAGLTSVPLPNQAVHQHT